MNRRALVSRLERIDWDFSGDNCASKFSTIHWHPCRFVSQIPAALIGLLSDPGDLVVDPYCGSGTTLVEAQRLGRRSLGIDINPVAILLARAKLFPSEAIDIERAIKRCEKEIVDQLSINSANDPGLLDSIPHTVQARKWFHPDTRKELAFLWSYIQNSKSKYKPILEAAFSSILLSVCNETRHWGYVCDNTKPKSARKVDAIKQYMQSLDRLIEAYRERDLYVWQGVTYPLPNATLVNEDACNYLKCTDEGSVDLIVTSPPYFGVCDYVKAQRLSMEWFGYEIEKYRQRETGARSKRHRKQAAHEYLEELRGVLTECYRTLKVGGYITIVMGESAARASIVREVRSILLGNRFDDVLVKERTVPVQRRQHPSIRNEYVLIARVDK